MKKTQQCLTTLLVAVVVFETVSSSDVLPLTDLSGTKAVEVSANFSCAPPSPDCVFLDWHAGSSGVATAKLEHEEGWAKLYVKTRPSVEGHVAMWAAGYLEGYLMKTDIEHSFANAYQDWFNSTSPDTNITAVRNWLQENHAWTRSQANQSKAPFWNQVKLVLAQLDGLAAGLKAAGSKLTLSDMILLNADGDLEDLVPMLASKRVRHRDRCSALIKLAQDRSDIFFGHSTWDHYDMMVRSLKYYDFELRGLPRQTMTLSSSPGFLSSLDDFFLTGQGLAVMETTNPISNVSERFPWLSLSAASVLSWMRSSVANALAHDGPEWAELFSTANSGTYNDQWMILDMKLFTPGHDLVNNTLIVLEQIPGYIEWHDMSKRLEKEGYWASYNVPAFSSIFEASGFSPPGLHSTAPRALIFKEQQANISDLASLERVLRYNDWQHDPLSNGSACNAISARCDLTPLDSAEWQLEGGIDAKASSVKLGLGLKFMAQNGPTFDQQPPFTWQDISAKRTLSHQGQPDLFNFSWIAFGPRKAEKPPQSGHGHHTENESDTEQFVYAVSNSPVYGVTLAAAFGLLAWMFVAYDCHFRKPLGDDAYAYIYVVSKRSATTVESSGSLVIDARQPLLH